MVDKEVVAVMEQVMEEVEEVADVRKKAGRWARRRSWRSCRGDTRRRSTRRSWKRWAVAGRGGLDCAAGGEEYTDEQWMDVTKKQSIFCLFRPPVTLRQRPSAPTAAPTGIDAHCRHRPRASSPTAEPRHGRSRLLPNPPAAGPLQSGPHSA